MMALSSPRSISMMEIAGLRDAMRGASAVAAAGGDGGEASWRHPRSIRKITTRNGHWRTAVIAIILTAAGSCDGGDGPRFDPAPDQVIQRMKRRFIVKEKGPGAVAGDIRPIRSNSNRLGARAQVVDGFVMLDPIRLEEIVQGAKFRRRVVTVL